MVDSEAKCHGIRFTLGRIRLSVIETLGEIIEYINPINIRVINFRPSKIKNIHQVSRSDTKM